MLWIGLTCLLGLSVAYINDNTDNYLFYDIHTLQNTLTRDSAPAPIRIHYELGALDLNPVVQEYVVSTMIFAAKAYLSKALQVNQPVAETLYLDVDECAGIRIPSYYNSYGFNGADIVIFLTGGESTIDEGSWASPCVREMDNLENMVAGRIWLNANQITANSDDDNIALLIHQTMHVLGFHSNAYQYWKDGAAAYTDGPIFSSQTRGKTVWKIGTPLALAQAKLEFGCETLDGVELESTYLPNVAGSNWEKRIMYNDVMSRGLDFEDNLYSIITLLALQETGWYTADVTQGQEILWGRGRGCTFFDDLCIVDGDPQFTEFCNTSNDSSMCGHSHLNKGVCGMTRYFAEIPLEYRYFDDEFTGGADISMDYCPYVVPFENGSCRDTTRGDGGLYGEKYGPTSRCVEGNYVEIGNYPRSHAGCHEITCNDDGTLDILVGQTTVTCPPEGGSLQIDGFAGYLFCPDHAIVCGTNTVPCPEGCFGRGTCTDGACECEAGWTGISCGSKCHISCDTCSAAGEGKCLTCKGDATLNEDEGKCECASLYIPETGDCVADCGTTLEPDEEGVNCVVKTDAMVIFLLSAEGASYASTGWDATPTADHCHMPYQDLTRGAFFNGNQALQLNGWFYSEFNNFTISMWAKPVEGGTLHHWALAGKHDAILDISECQGIVLVWGWHRWETSRGTLSTSDWSSVDLVANIEEKVDIKIGISVNGQMVLTGQSSSIFDEDNELLEEDEIGLKWIGATHGSMNYYEGWVYQFEFYAYAKSDLKLNTDCEDLDLDEHADCTFCLDAEEVAEGEDPVKGVCLDNCDINHHAGENLGDACLRCVECVTGCQADGSCYTVPSDGCGEPSCSAGCAFCVTDVHPKTDGNDCLACEDEFKLERASPSVCIACTDDCEPAPLLKESEHCQCDLGFYYNTKVSACLPCSNGCASCLSGGYFACTSCSNGFSLVDGGACTHSCPTGYSSRDRRCVLLTSGADKFTIKFNEPLYDHEAIPILYDAPNENYEGSNITMQGGYTSGKGYQDDPFAIKDRGAWFNGIVHHFTALNLVLNHSFTAEFFLKSYTTNEGTLLGTYQRPYEYTPDSACMYSLNIRNAEMVFRINNQDVYIETNDHVIWKENWQHIAYSVEWQQWNQSTAVQFFVNGTPVNTSNIASPFTTNADENTVEMPYFFLDSREYTHYVGGIKHQWKLYYPFEGFIYEMHISQHAKKDFSDTLFHDSDCDAGCSTCPSDKICPSDCEWGQFIELGQCCSCSMRCTRGCVRAEDCNLCDTSCINCSGWEAEDCITFPEP